MSGLLTTASQLMCPHGGTVSIVSSNSQVSAGGSPLARSSDTFMIAGCALSGNTPPTPCVTINWTAPNARSRVAGDFTLSQGSVGLCMSAAQVPQGQAIINMTQTQASGI